MKLVYLTTCFGTPSHTFIRREIRELRKQGHGVSLFGVRQDTACADDAKDLVDETTYLYPIAPVATFLANVKYLITKPGKYFKGIGIALSSKNGSLKRRLKVLYHLMVAARFASQFEREDVTHIHAHFLNVSSSIAMFASLLSNAPYSVTVHSAGERDLPHVDALASKLREAKNLLMISQFNIDYYSDVHPCQDKSKVVRCGMVMDQFIKREFVPPHNPLKVLAVGRFVEKKGFKYLVDAADILAQRGVELDVEILGSGPLHDDVKAQISTLKMQDIVKLPGHAPMSEVQSKMLAADVVVVPSVTSESGEMEGIPVVLMEAMASGVPVIGTAHSGIPELVRDDTGVLVPEKDATALADALQAFKADKAKIDKARALIDDQFNIEKVVQQRLKIFQS